MDDTVEVLRGRPVWVSEKLVLHVLLSIAGLHWNNACWNSCTGLRTKYEIHHGVAISEEALVAATKLSDRYITDRRRLVVPILSSLSFYSFCSFVCLLH